MFEENGYGKYLKTIANQIDSGLPKIPQNN